VRDREGREIGYFDLVWPELRIIVEYDGDQHRTSAYQYDRDIRRFDRASEAGYRVIRVRARGLGADLDETIARLRRAFAN
jgi:very-short-patch-repair endonuclease